jgi:hypothetical protein
VYFDAIILNTKYKILINLHPETDSIVSGDEQDNVDEGDYSESEEKKAYQVEYKVLSNNQLKEKQNNEINHVSTILGKNKPSSKMTTFSKVCIRSGCIYCIKSTTPLSLEQRKAT